VEQAQRVPRKDGDSIKRHVNCYIELQQAREGYQKKDNHMREHVSSRKVFHALESAVSISRQGYHYIPSGRCIKLQAEDRGFKAALAGRASETGIAEMKTTKQMELKIAR